LRYRDNPLDEIAQVLDSTSYLPAIKPKTINHVARHFRTSAIPTRIAIAIQHRHYQHPPTTCFSFRPTTRTCISQPPQIQKLRLNSPSQDRLRETGRVAVAKNAQHRTQASRGAAI